MGMKDYSMKINTTPDSETETMAELKAGISNIAQALNEVVEQATYLDGEGFGSSEVVGAQYIVTLTGKRVVGDTAQDFIFSKAFGLGTERKTTFEITDPKGNKISGDITIAKIGLPSGDVTASGGEITLELHFNGKPTYTPAG
jgi:hypothetical protein